MTNALNSSDAAVTHPQARLAMQRRKVELFEHLVAASPNDVAMAEALTGSRRQLANLEAD